MMIAFARMTLLVGCAIALVISLTSHPARAADVDPATPDYLRPLDARAAIETTRGPDGRLAVRIRGERFDGQRLVASLVDEAWRGVADGNADFDLQMQVTTLGGFNDETLTNVDLAVSRRGGRMSGFALAARAASDAPVRGDLISRRDGRPFVHLEADDAGALLRFVDIFAYMAGGRARMAVDLQSEAAAKRESVLQLHDFGVLRARLPQSVRDSVAAPLSPDARELGFSDLHAHATLAPGKITITQTMMRSQSFVATLEGMVEGESLNLRGYLLPSVLAEAERQNCKSPKGCLFGMPFTVQGQLQAPQIQIMTYLDMSHLHVFDDP
jgi:hypothetical protein